MRICFVLAVILGAVAFGFTGESALAQQGIFEQQTLTGDWGGARKQLQDAGVQLGLTDIAETLANPIGGISQGQIYDGLITATLDLDLEKLAKWPGAAFHVDGYQINGRGLSQNYVGNLLTVSSIEALPATRLHDLWLQQQFFDSKASVRVGQIALDDEFYLSQYSAIFINTTFGCPEIFAADLPSGGPCYPFAAPGVRLRVAPTAALTFSTAVFNGNPAPPGPGNPQVRNSSGTNFLIGEGGTLVISELAYTFDQEPTTSTWMSDVRLGGWYHSAAFPDLQFDTMGVSLAAPSSNGIAALHQGNFGPYLILDKMLWQPPNAETKGLAGFLRVGGAPGDRNLINLGLDAGLTYKGLLPGRDLDVSGVAASYARIGGAARGLAADESLFTGIEQPALDYEAVLEATYQLNIAPWWVLQPDLQVILHPGGHRAAPPPAPPGQPIANALVVGVRSSITF
ncbi:MAG: carbohydrate porin [Alphaproteobacteria bacterium]|nr:carbohydrate porin [Alphaproteobacteria bacterium]